MLEAFIKQVCHYKKIFWILSSSQQKKIPELMTSSSTNIRQI